ncbi:hypothetical protein CAPTEDRAFT_218924 [Capitella teleta]|uniref:IQ domain-containing protein E n=1 Tax=Capitella teleta TaxID=283909 RepID=R7V199_CAPTE|nr:hypothetical protein CAPTEDRAFT_218924 [Capitella teleta]|eukprot:ELU12618.1 hypothetical protein CAPTEDRAFT_218924 [Capitella teleta]
MAKTVKPYWAMYPNLIYLKHLPVQKSYISHLGVASGSKRGNLRKGTPTEIWTDTLRRTGFGITPETLGQKQSLTGLKPQDMTYKSTSHYLRQMAGTEKMNKSMGADSQARPSSGRPAYKSPEEYYDEVLALKKEREVEQLLDPSKSEEMRRTLTDKRPDTGTVIHSMKQKIMKLEHSLKDREAAFSKLQSDLKATKIEEFKIQTEMLHREITRLNNVKSGSTVSKSNVNNTSSAKENPSKLRALQETIMRMNEKNVRLQTENKTLKQDLQKALEEKALTADKKKEYEDMNKKELMTALTKLEKRLDRAEGDTLSIVSDVDGRRTKTEGKIVLEGSVAQRLDQLDKRESELLEELAKQKVIMKRLKEDRTHYRKKGDDKDREIKSLKKEIDELQAELDGFYDKDKSATPRVPTPRRKSAASSSTRRASPTSTVMSSASATVEKERLKKAEAFKENHAAKHIQREWRGYKQRNREEEERRVRRQRVHDFEEKHAAKTIQKRWRLHNAQEREANEATELIQAAMRGHSTRQANMKRMRGYMAEEDSSASDLDGAADFIQSSMRGHQHRTNTIHSLSKPSDDIDDESVEFMQAAIRAHLARKQQLNNYHSRDSSRGASPHYSSPRTRSPALSHIRNLDSAGEDVDSDDVYSVRSARSKASVSSRPSRTSSRPQSAVKKSRTPPSPASSDDDDDSDDDIVVTTNKRLF